MQNLYTLSLCNCKLQCKNFVIRVSAPTDSFNDVSRYGEMESFFYGLQLHDLIDVFKEQKVEFKQLLLLSEADLVQMGTWHLQKMIYKMYRLNISNKTLENLNSNMNKINSNGRSIEL